jgi:hypothetical protein
MEKPPENKVSAACARRAARDAAVQPPPQALAPSPPSGFAASGLRNAGDGESRAGASPRRSGQHRRREMAEDAELDLFRQAVNCAAVLERMIGGWKLDARESSRSALKYRRGKGEMIIVSHDGRGWWDATGSAKGRRVQPRPAPRSVAELRSGAPAAARPRRRRAQVPRGYPSAPDGQGRPSVGPSAVASARAMRRGAT